MQVPLHAPTAVVGQMNDFNQAFLIAMEMVLMRDPDLVEIIGLSLTVSLIAVAIASVIGLPVGAMLAVKHFPTRNFWASLLTAFMGLPPVVVGLFVYLMLSRSGPFGVLGLLYTPTAMIIAQTVLIFPIVAALTCQTVRDLHREYGEQLRSLGCGTMRIVPTLLWEGRFSLLTAVLAGFGRAAAEVGAVLIVGGNINHATRVMTTTITLETSKGNLALALALGMVLVSLSLLITFSAQALRNLSESRIHS